MQQRFSLVEVRLVTEHGIPKTPNFRPKLSRARYLIGMIVLFSATLTKWSETLQYTATRTGKLYFSSNETRIHDEAKRKSKASNRRQLLDIRFSSDYIPRT